MFPLAQITFDQVPLVIAWVIGASGTMFLVNQALTFYKEHIREKPTPADTYATKVQLDTELGRERGSRKKMHEEIAALQGDVKSHHTAIESLSQDVAAFNEQIGDVNKRIDEIPMRTIRLLNETKQLHE